MFPAALPSAAHFKSSSPIGPRSAVIGFAGAAAEQMLTASEASGIRIVFILGGRNTDSQPANLAAIRTFEPIEKISAIQAHSKHRKSRKHVTTRLNPINSES